MPTGYTAPIVEGTMDNGKDFLWRCARAFGAMVEMRDMDLDVPIPEAFHVPTYYIDSLTRALTALNTWKALSTEDRYNRWSAERLEMSDRWLTEKQRKAEVRQRLEKVLSDVVAWIPPSGDHTELQAYALDQVNGELERYEEQSLDPPKPIPFSEWETRQTEKLLKDLAWSAEALAKQERLARERTVWVEALRESLAGLSEAVEEPCD